VSRHWESDKSVRRSLHHRSLRYRRAKREDTAREANFGAELAIWKLENLGCGKPAAETWVAKRTKRPGNWHDHTIICAGLPSQGCRATAGEGTASGKRSQCPLVVADETESTTRASNPSTKLGGSREPPSECLPIFAAAEAGRSHVSGTLMLEVSCLSEHLVTQRSRASLPTLGQFDDPNSDHLSSCCGIRGQVQCLADFFERHGHGTHVFGIEGALLS
jgi:hypothetical protein